MNGQTIRGLLLVWLTMLVSGPAFASMDDDPLLVMVKADEFEWRDADDSTLAWDAEAWIGYDRDKLWLKTEGETTSESTEQFELQLLWGRAIAPNWDFQAGWRGDFQPVHRRSWLALGVQGLAPGFIETEATFYLADSGRAAARGKVSYELLFTQKLVLEPEAELNWYRDDDRDNGIASGLADVEFGLRLHYEIRRELAPYIGVHWEKKLGDTADLARDQGEDTSDLQLVAGFRFWF